MNFPVPNQGEGTLENTSDLFYSADHGASDPFWLDDLSWLEDQLYSADHGASDSTYCDSVLPGVDDLPSALEAPGRSRGSMEQGQLQEWNPNINSENETQLLNQDPGSKFGMTESNQRKRKRKRKTKCSSVAAASRSSGLKETEVAILDYLVNKLKNYKDQLRRINVKDKEKGLEYYLKSVLNVVGSKFSKDERAWMAEINKMLEEWPVRKDVSKLWTSVDDVKKSIEEAEKDGLFNIKVAELQQEVEKMGEAIKTLGKSRTKEVKFESDFLDKFCKNYQCNEGTSNNNLTAQGVSSSDPNAQGVSSSDLNAQGVSRTGCEDPAVVASPTKPFSFKYAEDFLKKLLGKENNKVEFSDFKCLQGNFPSLEFNSIDSKLIKLCGKAYEEAGSFANEKFLVLAAIKEMGEESLGESILLKWGAAFNKAEQVGYHMDFAKRHLERLACFFFGTHSPIIEEFNGMKKYVKAVSDMKQMKSFTDGMFPSDV